MLALAQAREEAVGALDRVLLGDQHAVHVHQPAADLPARHARDGTSATTRAGAALPPTSRSGKHETVKPVRGQLAEVHEPLDLRVREPALVRLPEDARPALGVGALGLEVERASQPQASMPITRTPRS